MLAFKAQYGDCQVEKLAETHKKLLQWVNVQRAQKSQEKLTEKRISLLESVGFGWQSVLNDDKWQNRYLELKSYHIQHGDADVPDQSKNYPKLAKWVGTMRVRKKQGKLDTERIKLLDEIQFSWKLRDRGAWEDHLDTILAFKQKYGHTNIPLNFPENPKLARFVNQNRTRRNKGELSQERIEKLDAVGFVWSASTRTVVGDDGLNLAWKARYQELIEYKNKFGDCVVKRANVNYEQLANWVEMQRRYNKLGKLHLERIRLLDEVGFLWVWVHPKHQKK